MKQIMRTGFALLSVVGALFPLSTQAKDLAGSQDYSLIKRYEGSEITWYAQKSYDSLRIARANL